MRLKTFTPLFGLICAQLSDKHLQVMETHLLKVNFYQNKLVLIEFRLKNRGAGWSVGISTELETSYTEAFFFQGAFLLLPGANNFTSGYLTCVKCSILKLSSDFSRAYKCWWLAAPFSILNAKTGCIRKMGELSHKAVCAQRFFFLKCPGVDVPWGLSPWKNRVLWKN